MNIVCSLGQFKFKLAFDESYLDDIATMELVWIIPNARPGGLTGQHDEVDAETPGAEEVVKINF